MASPVISQIAELYLSPQSSLVLSFDEADRLEHLEIWSEDFVEIV